MSESSLWMRAFDSLANKIQQESNPQRPGDYIGEDGLLYCGVCRTRKQTRVKVTIQGDTIERTPPVPCKCMIDEQERQRLAAEQQKKMQTVQELRKASLMGEQFKRSTFDSYHVNQHNGKHYKLATRYVQRFPEMLEKNQGMLFCGEPGTGKTFLAACIANALLDQGIPVMMTSFVKLVSLSNTDNRQDLIKKLNAADLLIIDDLGAERGSEFAQEQVYDFVDSRCQSGKPMIITTNMSLAEIMDTPDIRYKRIYERIIKYCWPMEFTGPSWRRSEAAERYNAMKALMED